MNAMVNLTLEHNPNSSDVAYIARRDIKAGEGMMYVSETGDIEALDVEWETDIKAGQRLVEVEEGQAPSVIILDQHQEMVVMEQLIV